MRMPPIPAVVMLPTETHHGYWPATVVAAIPLGHGNVYAVTVIEPTSSPDAPPFIATTASQSIHGFWVADEVAGGGSLAGTLGDMCELAGRPGYPSGI